MTEVFPGTTGRDKTEATLDLNSMYVCQSREQPTHCLLLSEKEPFRDIMIPISEVKFQRLVCKKKIYAYVDKIGVVLFLLSQITIKIVSPLHGSLLCANLVPGTLYILTCFLLLQDKGCVTILINMKEWAQVG